MIPLRRTVKRLIQGSLIVLLLSSHDMYLKLEDYFLLPNSEAEIQLFNGTFDRSENVITRDRMQDVSLVGNGSRISVDTAQWYERDSITYLRFTTGAEGTWVAGVSTRPRTIELAAEDFNNYLEHDGVLDMLAWREENDALDRAAVEKYSKHVKTIFQVGDTFSEDWKAVLGYPIEFVPEQNPYDLHPGHTLSIQLLSEGRPLADQLVYVGHRQSGGGLAEMQSEAEHTHQDGTTHSHETAGQAESGHSHHETLQLRTDDTGRINVRITDTGVWYVRTIRLEAMEEEGLTHESNWATLTFGIGEGHAHVHAGEGHEHEEGGIPSYVFWIGSLVLIGLLFLVFNRKK